MIYNFSEFISESRIYKQTTKLYIADSSIKNAGKGLFSKVNFKKGEEIAYFTGQLLTDKQCEKLVANSDLERCSYFIDLKACAKNILNREVKIQKPILDVYNSQCMAKWANDAEGYYKTGKKNNTKIGITNDLSRCFIFATKDIKPDEEIFLSYGKEYWKAYAENLN